MDRGAPESAGPVAIATFVNPALSVATKRELSNTAKLSVFKSVFVPILTYGHESWVMIERILAQVQEPNLDFCEESTVWQRGVPRLECAWGKKQVCLACPYLNLRYFGSKCTALKNKLVTLLRLFGAPQWFGARGIVAPSLHPWRDNLRQSAQLLNSQSSECRTTSPNW